MAFRGVVLMATAMVSACWAQVTEETPGWFEFDIPALEIPDASSVSLARLNAEPAGRHGFVSIAAGHFIDGRGERLRLFGTNVTGDSCFPSAEIAPRLAKRLRQYGFNCVRLHFMDFSWGTDKRDSLWADPATGTLSAANLAKLDRFIAECAANGIYINLNLHVGRVYPGSPQLPGSLAFRFSKSVDRWYEPFVAQMEEFCRHLLERVNPNTGRRYADEPAIACIEINNENTMMRDQLDDYRRLPAPIRAAFEQRWTAWLKQRYGTTAALRQAWSRDVIPLGDERLADATKWLVQNAGGAESVLEQSVERLRWVAAKAGSQSWNLQLQYKGLALDPGRYTLSFRARSDARQQVGICVMLDAEPWGSVGLRRTLTLTLDWQPFVLSGPVTQATAPGPLRLNISLLNQTGAIELESVSLRPGGGTGLGEGQDVASTVALPSPTAVDSVMRDYWRFLIATEMVTTRRLVRLLKDEIGCRMPVADTQVSYGGAAGVLREGVLCDYVDIHGYWEHPRYTRDPEKGWVKGFSIANTSQVTNAAGGTLGGLGPYRIKGRPFSVSEYNTPAPNDHGAELFPLFTAVASLQDWDAFYSYTYRDFGKDYENTFIKRWFHLIGRANVLVHAPACSLAFRRAMVSPSAGGICCTLPTATIPELAMQHGGLRDLWRELGGDVAATWLRQVVVELSDSEEKARLSGELSVPAGERLSDTGQLRWHPEDPRGAWFALDAPSVKFLIGHVGGRSLRVGDVVFDLAERPWPRELPAYACVSLVALDELPIASSKRLLLAASARTENSNLQWDEERTSFPVNDWGVRPTLSESVPLTVTLPGASVRAVALDPSGMPAAALQVDGTSVKLCSEDRTLWALLTRD